MAMLEPLSAVLASMIEELARLPRAGARQLENEKTCRQPTSTPGIGPVAVGLRGPHGPARALTYRSTIDRPERFDRSRDVGAHLALTPSRYRSGETDIVGKISPQIGEGGGDELARTGLVEAAHALLIRSSKWSALRAWGLAIAKPRGMAEAKIAVARKLAVILHRMWVDGTDFRFGKEAAA